MHTDAVTSKAQLTKLVSKVLFIYFYEEMLPHLFCFVFLTCRFSILWPHQKVLKGVASVL